jgi:hypothetical protein
MCNSTKSKLKMATLNPKVRFLFKPTQSRKTQYTIDQIRADHEGEQGHFFIYGCHCIISAANQTLGRIEDAYPEGEAPGDVLMFSSEVGKCNTPSEVKDKLTLSCPTTYMGMCLLIHKARFKGTESHIMQILRFIEQRMPEITKVTMYFDEFDRYEFLIKYLDPLCSFNKVTKLQLVSATYRDSKLFKVFGDIPEDQIEELEESFDRENYVTYEEQERLRRIVIEDDMHSDVIGYIVRNISTVMSVRKLNPGKSNDNSLYICAPCSVKRDAHERLVGELRKLNVTTVLFNSDFKGAILPDGSRIRFDLSLYAEPSKLIKFYKKRFNLNDIVVTGNLCIGRAVTLQRKKLVFDYCILHHDIASSGDAIYQADRSKGNTKLFSKKLCVTICTPKVLKILKSREQYALIGETGRSAREHIRMVDVGLKTYDPSMTVPRIFTVTDEDMAIILPRKGPNRHMAILGLLARLDTEFAQKIWFYKCIQASESKSDSSYKKHITDVVSAAKHRQPYAVDIKPEHKSENIWECFIDSKENRLCFIVWEGAR